MKRASERLLTLFVYATLYCSISSAQTKPMDVAVRDLSQTPRKFDGLLVRVRARAVVGWEGDDFLYDPTEQAGGNKAPGRAGAVWFYCNAENGRRVYAAIDRKNSFTTATFTGYFHFVPDPKNRGKHMFDPGRLQLEVVGISDVAKSQAR
ncbi:MAG TPA: hypothetical protein VNX60_14545 [Candidatus Acidoferrum sp.]|jgi:hypothetical protein|nr:hypothetical protein [Candidatus Acidoferrum sp.]